MRYLFLCLVAIAVCAASVTGSEARTTIGDIPRTYSHYMNSHEAALCRANAATGGLVASFLNPAAASEVLGAAGHATVRYNITSRDYLPGGEDALDSSEDGFLFSQAVAAKRSGPWTLGFSYSSPSYRSLEITGRQDGETYRGEFKGSLRYFEGIFAMRIGDSEQGGIGVSAGMVGLEESARIVEGPELEKADVSGMAASVSIGMVFDATESITIGVGHRWGSEIEVEGEWFGLDGETGKSSTQPTTVAGVRFRPTETAVIYASYIHEGWDRTSSTLAAYRADDGARNEFGDPLRTVALGAEGDFLDGGFTARVGGSFALGSDISDALVPEYSIGLGGSVHFEQYALDLALTRELFELDGESGQAANYGVYLSVAYEFH
jgi:hypothetical protein